MKSHFCRVGRRTVSPLSNNNLDELEKNHNNMVEQAYSTMHTDSSLSDLLFHEASKIKKKILSLKNDLNASNLDAAF
ncbi:Lacal_2735 family protein [Mangrovimonas sp. CR14]|uniref:Lacal_2735 family protein n=1 Tax=Mangrovimonas sp. CR14 TaxID=2706120 RepID=UPI001421EB5A|nr:Lacal_2735 family protein [Mangrovimonas sp. CR14]NIK92277.1 Lacal_2735 family protein [Mangrovimonas sp. CR14]